MIEPTQGFSSSLVSVPIDVVCDAFLFQHSKQGNPRIEEFLGAAVEPQRTVLLRKLISLDIAQRISKGEQPKSSEYESRFPDKLDSIAEILRDSLDDTNESHAVSEVSTVAGPSHVSQAAGTITQDLGFSVHPAPQTSSVGNFGDYDLLSKIAQGGMGVVYKANQRSLNRIVALKMILAGQFADDSSIKRFYAEAKAAAMLKHPNIVAVHEVGQHGDQHYFSMDYVEGQSLSGLIRESPLSDGDAANYTKQVTDAMEYAHSQGILHRDLKPGNVLLDGDGRALVTDFGLAKSSHADSELTATGQVLGTPAYMPPEQATASTDLINVRSDVYSIGAILYCALTGRPPFQAANLAETIRQVIDHEPISPRDINPSVSRDLETICLKCLEKNASRRYATAQELSDDLGRFLNGQPILARPVSQPERLVKWTRRRPAIAALIAVSVFAALTVLGITLNYNRRLRTTNSDLKTALEGEANQTVIAKEQADHAAQLGGIALETLASVVGDTQNGLRGLAGAQKIRETLLDDSIQRLNKLADSLGQSPVADRNVAAAHVRLAIIYFSAGNESGFATDEAHRHLELARNIAQQLVDEDPEDDQAMLTLSRAHENLGGIARQRGDVKKGLEHYLTALDLSERLRHSNGKMRAYNLGVLHQKVGASYEAMSQFEMAMEQYQLSLQLEQEAVGLADDGDMDVVHNAVGFAHERVGDLSLLKGNLPTAQLHFDKAFGIAKALAELNPNDYRFQSNLATRYGILAKLRKTQNDMPGARELYKQQLDICENLSRSHPEHSSMNLNLAEAAQKLADVELSLGETDRASELLDTSIGILQPMSDADPEFFSYRDQLARAYQTSGRLQLRVGAVTAALESHTKCLEIYEFLAERDRANTRLLVNVALANEDLGNVHMRMKDIDAAEIAFQKSLDLRFDLAESDPSVSCNNRNLSVAYNSFLFLKVQQGKFAEAREAGQRGLVIAEGITRSNPASSLAQQDLSVSLEYLGNIELTAGDPEAAAGFYQRCAQIRQQLADAAPEDAALSRSVSVMYGNLGQVCLQTEDWSDARRWLGKSLEIKKSLAADDPDDVRAQTDLSQVYGQIGDIHNALDEHREAMKMFQKQLDIAESVADRDAADLSTQLRLAMACRKIGLTHFALQEAGQATSSLNRAMTIGERLAKDAPGFLNHHLHLADVYENLGDITLEDDESEAEDWFRKSLAVRKSVVAAVPGNAQFAAQLEMLEAKLPKDQ